MVDLHIQPTVEFFFYLFNELRSCDQALPAYGFLVVWSEASLLTAFKTAIKKKLVHITVARPDGRKACFSLDNICKENLC